MVVTNPHEFYSRLRHGVVQRVTLDNYAFLINLN